MSVVSESAPIYTIFQGHVLCVEDGFNPDHVDAIRVESSVGPLILAARYAEYRDDHGPTTVIEPLKPSDLPVL